jgi:transglutaminase-like putative cysteine protease
MRWLLIKALCLLWAFASAQESPYARFGKITTQDLQRKLYALDSSADAVTLSDIGSAFLQGNLKGWFSLIKTRHSVVHILNKAAYANPADPHNVAVVEIQLYTDGENEEKLEDLKAVTYNLHNGKMVESKLDKGSVFTERVDKNHIVKKFTFPAVTEGSIIEYQYKISSDFLGHIEPWYFQGYYMPRLWSEFVFSVPEFYTYSFVNRGYIVPYRTQKTQRNEQFLIREVLRSSSSYAGYNQAYTVNAGVTDYRTVMKDVPALKAENFTSSLRNHVARLECQLVSQNKPLTPRNYLNTWPDLIKTLLESDYFGKGLMAQTNAWLSEEAAKLVNEAAGETDKAKAVFWFARNNIVCTGNSGLYTQQSPQNTFRTRKGTVSEINLLLTALLRHAGLRADPVILSTRENGFTVESYPLLSPFNYVVVQVQAGGKTIYLDASQKYLGFGKLLSTCYNGHARVVNEAAAPVYFVADSLKERKTTALYLARGNKALWSGSFSQTPGYYASFETRKKLIADGPEKFLKDMQKEFNLGATLATLKVDSLNDYESPITIHCDVHYSPDAEGVLYINPMFEAGYKTNPFKSAERRYPVEMPYTTDETFSLTMEVPDDYVVEELPKNLKARFDAEGKTSFEYLVQNINGIISLRSRIKIDRALYEPEEYEGLREFFNLIVKKHNEQIVFKKKN